MSNLTKYNSYEAEQAEQDAEEAKKVGGEFIKPPSGETQYRFLPPVGAMRSPFVVVHKHFINLPGMSKMITLLCPRLMAKRHCPVCAKIDALRATGNPSDADIASDMYPQFTVYANVIVRGSEELGPQKLQFGKKVHEQLTKLRVSKAGGDFTNPTEDGFDVVIDRAGEKMQTTYTVRALRDSSPLHEDAATASGWIETQANLLQYARVPTDEEIARMLGGVMGGGGARRGTPPPVRGAAPAAAPRRRTAADDMQDDGGGADPE